MRLTSNGTATTFGRVSRTAGIGRRLIGTILRCAITLIAESATIPKWDVVGAGDALITAPRHVVAVNVLNRSLERTD